MKPRIDILNRKPFIDNIVNIVDLLAEDEKSCTFAINGKWGYGKTFVVNEIEKRLKSEKCSDGDREKYCVFNYNCWQHDFYEEPVIAILSVMIDQLKGMTADLHKDEALVVAVEALKTVANNYVKSKYNIDIKSSLSSIQNKLRKLPANTFDENYDIKKVLNDTKSRIQELSSKMPIVILVDELDRCIPEYAIKTLERLHHLFADVENVIVLIAVDSSQLENTIKQIYGAETSAESYLRKFIDFSITLDKGELIDEADGRIALFMHKFDFSSDDEYQESFNAVKTIFKAVPDIRTQEKLINKAEIINKLVFDNAPAAYVLVFELLLLTCINSAKKYDHIYQSDLLSVILDHNNERYLGVRKDDPEFSKMLKQLDKDGIVKDTFGDFFLKNNVVGKAFEIAEYVRNSIKNNGTTRYSNKSIIAGDSLTTAAKCINVYEFMNIID